MAGPSSTGAPMDSNPEYNSPGTYNRAPEQSQSLVSKIYKHTHLQDLVKWVKANKIGESRSSVNT